ncbi:CotD family spore coat protein [Virgibacillus sp. 179-BFC.A HS]|uniref:CotD family spore coat protein n=1 Tax=Tigheibacillus jepli TaxID=3035914 RepID=A0ABU5CKP3_9BACI|nr:CotD family spore coat protein [Virgibacillus sp. 179-BFC.A HS]MDY0406407.1 CotD family spore coat protein [Virgibacillus sp. 179-BFC.A HS]
MSFQHGNPCACHPRRIVYPVKQNCVHCCTESEIEHVHPEHTTFMNHHVIKNRHVFPKTASVQNTCSSVNMYGGPAQMPMMQGPGNGMMDPAHHHMHGHHHHHHGHHHGHHFGNNWES